MVRLDRSFFHGGNFERYLYEYEGKIHLMGGYGLFNTNNNIEVFDFKTQEWSVIKTTGNKPPFIRGLCLKVGDFIYSFYNSKVGNNTEDDKYDSYIYRLDLKKNTWKRIENINVNAITIFDKIYTSDYCIGIMQNTALVFNKNTREFISIPREILRVSLRELFNYSVNNNTLSFQNYLTTHANSISYEINIDSLWKRHEKHARLFVLEPAWYQISIVFYASIIVISFIIFGILIYYIKRRKSINTKILKHAKLDSPNAISEKIMSSTKTILDIDELDELLEINHMEFDSRKLKRHRLLSDLEKTNPGLIIRQKDETDKRRFIYIIQKS